MSTNQVVVDTDVIIDWLRRIEPQRTVFRRLFEENRVFLTTVSAYELRVGSELTRGQVSLEPLFEPDRTLSFDLLAAVEAGKIETELRGRRQEIGPGDTLIAGICLSRDLAILTRNHGHFSRVPGLEVLTPADFQ